MPRMTNREHWTLVARARAAQQRGGLVCLEPDLLRKILEEHGHYLGLVLEARELLEDDERAKAQRWGVQSDFVLGEATVAELNERLAGLEA